MDKIFQEVSNKHRTSLTSHFRSQLTVTTLILWTIALIRWVQATFAIPLKVLPRTMLESPSFSLYLKFHKFPALFNEISVIWTLACPAKEEVLMNRNLTKKSGLQEYPVIMTSQRQLWGALLGHFLFFCGFDSFQTLLMESTSCLQLNIYYMCQFSKKKPSRQAQVWRRNGHKRFGMGGLWFFH